MVQHLGVNLEGIEGVNIVTYLFRDGGNDGLGILSVGF